MPEYAPNLPPGPHLPRPLQAYRWLFAPIPFMQSCADRYGDPFTVRMSGLLPMVFFTEPSAIRQIFTGDPQQFRAGQANRVFKAILGPNSLLLLDGSRHRRERKLLMPPFHGARMRLYGEMMWAIADRSVVVRQLKNDLRIGDTLLPGGCIAVPCMHLTHRRPDLWNDPEVFDPTRFLGERPDPYSFFPFGGGVRHCVGAAFATYEMKVILARVLSRVDVRRGAGGPVRSVRRGLLHCPSGNLRVIAKRRGRQMAPPGNSSVHASSHSTTS